MRAEIIARALRQSRGTARERLLKKGVIEFAGAVGTTNVNCTVWNISEAGARLTIITPPGIPDYFDLVMDHSRRACRVVWRRLKRDRTSIQLGVAFE